MVCQRFPVSDMLVITEPLLKKAANGGKPLVVRIMIIVSPKATGIAFLRPPINRMSRVPKAWIMPPATRNPSPSKKAWLIMWKRLANQPRDEEAAAPEDPRAAIIKPS